MSEDIVNAVIIQSAIGRLENTIKESDKQNIRLQKSIFYLTIVMAILAVVQVIGMIISLK